MSEQDKVILENTPEGANHYIYGWLINPHPEYKNKTNILDLVKLRDEVAELKAKINQMQTGKSKV
jgi:hypothetical protein